MMWVKTRTEKKALAAQGDPGEAEYGTLTEKSKKYIQHLSNIRFTGALALNWMANLADDVPLSKVTIPGTHDSAAYTVSWPYICTQKMSILQQLDAGVRFFDLRCGLRDDILEMVHGVTYLGNRLETVLDTMYDWLMENSSEGLIVQVKEDRKSQRSTVEFAHAVLALLGKKPDQWRTANTTPSLGELRGRIQLFRRFVIPSELACGMDLTEWQDNPRKPFTIYTCHFVRITIQDHYKFSTPAPLSGVIAKKGGNVSELLENASSDLDENHWFINFTSAWEFNFQYQITPREVATGGWSVFKWVEGMNVRLRTYLRENKSEKRCLGIVAMDFPETGADDLVTALIRTNFGHRTRSLRSTLTHWTAVIVLLLVLVSTLYMLLRQLQTTLFTNHITQGLFWTTYDPLPAQSTPDTTRRDLPKSPER